MRVGVVTSSKNIVLSLKKNLMLIFAMTLLYAINSFAIGEIKLLPGTEGGGELRPFIFVPALAAIIFGPTVGAFSAGLGNFVIDFVNDILLEGSTLDTGNLAGFIGNFVGAAVVGFLSWRLNFGKDDKVIFSGKVWLRYLQNTLAAIVGMGLVTGETIGLLRMAFGKSTWEIGNLISASIFYSNSAFLLVTIIPFQLLVGAYEKIQAKRYDEKLHDSKNVTVVEEPENPSAIIEKFEIIPGTSIDGLVKGEWSQIKMTIKNNTTVPMAFRLEVNCEDRIVPSVEYTKLLQPQESDDKFLQVNPFNDSKRVFTIYIKNWSTTFKELTETSKIGLSVRYRYTYSALTPFEHRFNLFTKFLTICAFAVVIFNTIRTIYGEIEGQFWEQSQFFIWALVICGVELLIVIGWHVYKYIRIKSKINQAIIDAKEERRKAKIQQEQELQKYQQELKEISEQYDLDVSIQEEEPEISVSAVGIESSIDEIESKATTESIEPVEMDDIESTPGSDALVLSQERELDVLRTDYGSEIKEQELETEMPETEAQTIEEFEEETSLEITDEAIEQTTEEEQIEPETEESTSMEQQEDEVSEEKDSWNEESEDEMEEF